MLSGRPYTYRVPPTGIVFSRADRQRREHRASSNGEPSKAHPAARRRNGQPENTPRIEKNQAHQALS